MAKPVYLFLHGYGSNEDDLPGLVEYLPKLSYVSPRAPLTLQPGSYAWAPITVPGNPSAEPVEAATAELWEWIDANVQAGSMIIPIGFSQGGMMATQLLRTRPERVLATVVLSGFTLGTEQPADALLREELPPLIYCRGLEDNVVSADAVTRTEDWVKQHTTATVKSYYRLGHSVDNRVMDDVAAFLSKIL
jgi:phospholipase/carboxylesterase